MNDCSFCAEFHGDEANNFFAIHLQGEFQKVGIQSRIIGRSRNFFVLPMIGPLVRGYLLVIPRIHFLSFAHLPVELVCEAQMIMDSLREIFSIHYCPPIFFEHGPMGQSRKGGCCTDHAHLHVVAVECDVVNKFATFTYEPRRVNDLMDLSQQLIKDVPYLYYENQKGERWLMDAPVVESQFIRKLIAIEIGAPERAYWFNSLQISWIIDIIKRLKPVFDSLKGTSLWL